MVQNGAVSHKVDFVVEVYNLHKLKRYQNRIIGFKDTAIFWKGEIFLLVELYGEGCARKLVTDLSAISWIFNQNR